MIVLRVNSESLSFCFSLLDVLTEHIQDSMPFKKKKKKRVPLKFEGKFSHIAIRSAILHELECWVVKNQQKIKA